MFGSTWTADEEARVRELHEAGLTQRQIAAQLGRTHDSVARKTRQLRLVQRIGRPRAADGHFEPTKLRPNRGPTTLPPLASLQDVE
jgi:IS30 family transposase